MLKKLLFIFFLIIVEANAQKKPIQIIEEKKASKISFYALNETYEDYDVMITIKGTNIKQSASKPRFVRVPATSKVLLKNIFELRGKKAVYNYQLVINDSLSKRAIRRPFTLVKVPPKKIEPKKAIIIYITEKCINCDSIVNKLTSENYAFRSYRINENPELRKQLIKILAKPENEIDLMSKPVVNLGGKIYTWIENYEQLMEELNRE